MRFVCRRVSVAVPMGDICRTRVSDLLVHSGKRYVLGQRRKGLSPPVV